MTRPTRLAIVMDHPAQQFTRALELLSAEVGVQAHVYYWSVAPSMHDPDFGMSVAWDVDLLGGYPWTAPKAGHRVNLRAHWLIAQLRRMRPDVIICYGWASPIARVSILYSLLTHTRLLMYGDATWQHSNGNTHRLVRSALLRILMGMCTGAVSTGTFNREFYIRHGIDPRRIWAGVCPADTDAFESARAGGLAECGTRGRALQIGFAGKLIARKGPDELLRAVALLPRDPEWRVTIIGDGPLKGDLETLAAELGVGGKVTFQGFANTTEMPKLLSGFDVVVVPSRLDMRVLVTIEAMAAGAAVVVSDATAVWGPGDLVEHGTTGLVYSSGDPAALAVELRRLLTDQSLLAKIRSQGTRRALDFGPKVFARTIASAARMCLHSETIQGVNGG